MFLIKGVNVMDEILNLSINEMPQIGLDFFWGKTKMGGGFGEVNQ